MGRAVTKTHRMHSLSRPLGVPILEASATTSPGPPAPREATCLAPASEPQGTSRPFLQPPNTFGHRFHRLSGIPPSERQLSQKCGLWTPREEEPHGAGEGSAYTGHARGDADSHRTGRSSLAICDLQRFTRDGPVSAHWGCTHMPQASLEIEKYLVTTWIDKDGRSGRLLRLMGKKARGGPIPQIDVYFERRWRTLTRIVPQQAPAASRVVAGGQPQAETQSVVYTNPQGELKSSSAAWEMTVHVDRDEFTYFYDILRNESPIRFSYGSSVGLAEGDVTTSEVEWINLGTLEFEPVGEGPADRS
jgi:hypothetical protein